MYPVALEVPEGDATPGGEDAPDWRTLVKSVRRQLRGVPGNGLGYGALRYLADEPVRQRLAGDGPQVVFNYLGQFDSRSAEAGGGPGLYYAVHPSIGQDHDPADRGGHSLEVVGEAQGGRLGSPGTTSPTCTTGPPSRWWPGLRRGAAGHRRRRPQGRPVTAPADPAGRP